MNHISASAFTRRFSVSGKLALIVALALGVVGCADMLTYSKDSDAKGRQLYSEGQYADAAGAYRNATRQNPRDYQAYYMMGNCYEQLGQHQQAISSYRTSLDVQAITIEGKYDDQQKAATITALAAAIARSDSRDIETNAAVSKARSTQNPDDFLLLAKIYVNRGDADSAIEAYDHAALLGPDNFEVAKEYGLYLERLGQQPRAEAALRRAYALNQQDTQVNAALRRVGVVPGPSIKAEKDLVRPPLPKGPIPEVDLSRMNSAGGNNAPAPTVSGTVSAPRD